MKAWARWLLLGLFLLLLGVIQFIPDDSATTPEPDPAQDGAENASH